MSENISDSKYNIEDVQEGIEIIQENAVQNLDYKEKLAKKSEKQDVTLKEILAGIKQVEHEKETLLVKIENENAKLFALEKGVAKQRDQLLSVENTSHKLNVTLQSQRQELADMIKNHEASMIEFAKKFRESPALYDSEKLLKEVSELKIECNYKEQEADELETKISSCQEVYIGLPNEESYNGAMDLMNEDMAIINKHLERLSDIKLELEKKNQKLEVEISQGEAFLKSLMNN